MRLQSSWDAYLILPAACLQHRGVTTPEDRFPEAGDRNFSKPVYLPLMNRQVRRFLIDNMQPTASGFHGPLAVHEASP